jgi:hypothetical protein
VGMESKVLGDKGSAWPSPPVRNTFRTLHQGQKGDFRSAQHPERKLNHSDTARDVHRVLAVANKTFPELGIF